MRLKSFGSGEPTTMSSRNADTLLLQILLLRAESKLCPSLRALALHDDAVRVVLRLVFYG